MFSAYTIKKILPRLIAAVILIQFSYYIVGFAVDIANVLGKGVDALVLAPVKNLHINLADGNDTASLSTLTLGGLGLVAGVPLLVANIGAGVGAVFLLMLPALLAFVGVLFTLVFRQILIVILAILSPVAFVAMVLPGTERFFKMWWDHLLKALMMYPLIILLFTSGTLVAVIATNANVGSQEVGQFIAIIAVVAPLFLIPLTFKFAGTAIGAVAGGITALANRGAYGKDGKGGFAAGARERVAKRKLEQGALQAPGTKLGDLMYKNRALRNMMGAGARSGIGIGKKSESLATAKWNQGVAEAGKELEARGHNNPGVLEEFERHGRDAASLMRRVRQLQQPFNSDEDIQKGRELQGMLDLAGRNSVRAAAGMKAAEVGKASEASVGALVGDLKNNPAAQASVLGAINFNAKSKDVSKSGHHVDAAGNYRGIDPSSVIDNITKRWSAEEIAGQLQLGNASAPLIDPATGRVHQDQPDTVKYIYDILTGVHGSTLQGTLKDKLNQAAGNFMPPPIPGGPPPPGGGGAPPSQLSPANQQFIDVLRGQGLL